MSTDVVSRAARARASKVRAGIANYLETMAVVDEIWRLEDWRTLGYDGWESYLDGEFGAHRLRISPQDRQDAIVKLRLGGMSTRAISAVVGVDQSTVSRRLSGDANASPERSSSDPDEISGEVVGRDGKVYAARTTPSVRVPIRPPDSPIEAAPVEVTDPVGEREALVSLRLTLAERRFLAMHARYESNHQDDPRYQHADLVERARLKARWREIADVLHHDPLGEQT